jgi:hypothetical protein
VSKNESAENDTMRNIKRRSRKKTENDTTEKSWTRTCRICKDDLQYKSKKSFLVAKWNDSVCRKCSRKGEAPYSRQCPSCKTLLYYTSKVSLANSARHNRCCYECRNSGVNNPFFGKQHTSEHKNYMRSKSSNKVVTRFGRAFYNPTACKYFDSLMLEHGWTGRHAENGGEVVIKGYFVDFYDEVNNIIVEYDEPHHEKPSKKKRDIERQNIIIRETGCRFFRYSEKYNKLYEVFINE